MWESIKHEFEGKPLFEAEIKLKVGEGEVAHFMTQLNKEFPLLELGSYPTLEPERGFKTQLVFRSLEEKIVQSAIGRFRELCGAQDFFA
jgi:hypothetical protein